MNSLPKRLESLLSGGRKRSERVNQVLGERVFPNEFYVALANDYSEDLANRVVLTPTEFEFHRAISFVSSRLSRDLGKHFHWFKALRTGLVAAKNENRQIVTVEKTTCDRYLRRAQHLFGSEVYTIVPAEKHSFQDWLRWLSHCRLQKTIFLSPPLFSPPLVGPQKDQFALDDLLLAFGRRIQVLKVKRGSGTAARIQKLLRTPQIFGGSIAHRLVFIYCCQHEVNSEFFGSALNQGAVAWHIQNTADKEIDTECHEFGRRHSQPAEMIPLNQWDQSDRFLFHCTRARHGPWPDQTPEEYLDSFLQGLARPRTSLATLARINSQALVKANSLLNRTKIPVVSLTELSLAKIRHMRKFRAHLSRWDFEPYGIGFHQPTLIDRFNAQPVQYATEKEFENLSPERQPFFQIAHTKTQTGNVIDWTQEKEWRVVGDIPLNQFEDSACVFFVPTRDDAKKLAKHSRFRVIVLGSYSN